MVDSLDKQMQNEKERIHLASAGAGDYFLFGGKPVGVAAVGKIGRHEARVCWVS